MVFITTLVLSILKVTSLVFPKGYYLIEVALIFIYAIISFIRINSGLVGNRIESISKIT